MKVIVTAINPDGTYDDVGMNNRRLFTGKTFSPIVRKAKALFPGRTLRLEKFDDHDFYGQPRETEYVFYADRHNLKK